jgi:hypothetical protein
MIGVRLSAIIVFSETFHAKTTGVAITAVEQLVGPEPLIADF